MKIEVLHLTSRPALGPMRAGQVVEVDDMDLNGLQEARDLINRGEARLIERAPRVHDVRLADGIDLADQ